MVKVNLLRSITGCELRAQHGRVVLTRFFNEAVADTG